MKRYSPVIFGLLVAAMLAVDAVVIVWYKRAGMLSLAAILLDALFSAQLGIACLWAVLGAKSTRSATFVVGFALASATVPAAMLDILPWHVALAVYGSYVALLIVALWMLKRTQFWDSLTHQGPTIWQFSVMNLLVAMTVVAVLIALFRDSEFANYGEGLAQFLAALTLGDALAIVLTLVSWAMKWHWLQRLAAVFAAAVVLGIVTSAGLYFGTPGLRMQSFAEQLIDYVAYYVIMAAIVFAWLELAPIVPHDRRAASLPPAGADAS